jgi:hypothetical protein
MEGKILESVNKINVKDFVKNYIARSKTVKERNSKGCRMPEIITFPSSRSSEKRGDVDFVVSGVGVACQALGVLSITNRKLVVALRGNPRYDAFSLSTIMNKGFYDRGDKVTPKLVLVLRKDLMELRGMIFANTKSLPSLI